MRLYISNGVRILVEPRGERGPNCTTGISRSRLNPDTIKNLFSQNQAVGDAVERDPTGHTKIWRASHFTDTTRQPQHDLVRNSLDRTSDIHVTLFDWGIILARRSAK